MSTEENMCPYGNKEDNGNKYEDRVRDSILLYQYEAGEELLSHCINTLKDTLKQVQKDRVEILRQISKAEYAEKKSAANKQTESEEPTDVTMEND